MGATRPKPVFGNGSSQCGAMRASGWVARVGGGSRTDESALPVGASEQAASVLASSLIHGVLCTAMELRLYVATLLKTQGVKWADDGHASGLAVI